VTQTLSQGLWGVLATPFDDGLSVDLGSLRNEAASFAADGACGLVALGVFGEAASLHPDEANSVAETVASSTALP
jgi:4-hydroxy-tetrahydrodipicolinate synthase